MWNSIGEHGRARLTSIAVLNRADVLYIPLGRYTITIHYRGENDF